MQEIKLEILGNPMAQKRHRSVNRGGFTRQYDPCSSDKADFLSLAHKNAPETPFDFPVDVDLKFYFVRPKSHFRTGKYSGILKDNAPRYHTSRNDVDNLAKFVFDALNGIYWKDDSFISKCTIVKEYSERPRTEITVNKIKV